MRRATFSATTLSPTLPNLPLLQPGGIALPNLYLNLNILQPLICGPSPTNSRSLIPARTLDSSSAACFCLNQSPYPLCGTQTPPHQTNTVCRLNDSARTMLRKGLLAVLHPLRLPRNVSAQLIRRPPKPLRCRRKPRSSRLGAKRINSSPWKIFFPKTFAGS